MDVAAIARQESPRARAAAPAARARHHQDRAASVGRDHLFGTRAEAGFTQWREGKAALDKRLGKSVAPWHVHDLRRTFATRLSDLGTAPHIVENALNHRTGFRRGIAAVYNKSRYERETRTALALWNDHIRALIEGTERKIVAFEHRA